MGKAKNHREEERICRLVAGLFEEGEEGLAEDPGAQVSISTKAPWWISTIPFIFCPFERAIVIRE